MCVSETSRLWKPRENASFPTLRLTSKLPARDPSLGQGSFQAESKTWGSLAHKCKARERTPMEMFQGPSSKTWKILLFSTRKESLPTWRCSAFQAVSRERTLRYFEILSPWPWSVSMGAIPDRHKTYLKPFSNRSAKTAPLLSWTSLWCYLRNQLIHLTFSSTWELNSSHKLMFSAISQPQLALLWRKNLEWVS